MAKKSLVVKAEKKIHSAIQQEEQSQEALEKSVDNLADVLEALDIEPYDDD